MRPLSEHVSLHEGSVCVGIVRAGDRAILLDYGDGAVEESLRDTGVSVVERILLTHHHRDQASGLVGRPMNGVRVGVPASEREWFENVESYWNDPKRRWHLYDDRPHPLMLTESVAVHDAYRDGDSFEWGPARITVLETSGHTDGSVSYLVEADGRRFAFCGDLLCDDGSVWDLYSLQHREEAWSDYHGFLGARKQLVASLERVLAVEPDLIVPSHGRIVEHPREAIERLRDRLATCYDRYVAVSALRHYFPKPFTAFEGSAGHMPFGASSPAPEFLRHIGTTWVILSETGEAFVMDCGSEHVIRELERLIERDEVARVSELWVTHYHDDHVDAIPAFQRRFDCVTRTDTTVADVLENPLAYRTPCISPAVARVDHRTKDGDSWEWNEFRMTAYHFPGQTYWHAGLFAEGRGARMFFCGDSFTPSGMDDYCAPNRTLLGDGVGYDRCLTILADLKPTHLFNCHVDSAFRFTDEELEWMRRNLRERERLYGELVAWEHPNYGLDPHWARCYPYEQTVTAGSSATLRVEFTNHSDAARVATCRPVLPREWNLNVSARMAIVGPKSDGCVVFRIPIPSDAARKRTVVPVEITYGGMPLGQFREAILVVP